MSLTNLALHTAGAEVIAHSSYNSEGMHHPSHVLEDKEEVRVMLARKYGTADPDCRSSSLSVSRRLRTGTRRSRGLGSIAGMTTRPTRRPSRWRSLRVLARKWCCGAG